MEDEDMLTYRLLIFVKLAFVALYAGGLVTALVATTHDARRRGAHRIAASGFVGTWAAGYVLSLVVRVPLTELWILGGLVLSFASKLALVRSVSRDRATRGDVVAAVAPFLGTLALMVFRPTWDSLRS